MVVFLDLDDDVSDPHADPSQPPVFALPRCLPSHTSVTAKNNLDIKDDTEHERPNPNISTFSAALGCYP